MKVIGFPTQNLTTEEEVAIAGHIRRDGHYCCRREVDAASQPELVLLNGDSRERGRVAKRHGVFAVLDARGHTVLRTRDLGEVLCALRK